MSDDFKLKIKGKAFVCIDWANIYGWQKKLGWKIDAHKLIKYFESYPEVNKIKFYFGTDRTQGSKDFISSIRDLEDKIFNVVTKNVKYVPVQIVPNSPEKTLSNKKRRKCDFDVEITRDTLNNIDQFQAFVLLSGDGDYAPLIQDLIEKKKKTILIFAPGHKGKEYGDFKKGLFLCSVLKIKKYLQK